MNVLTIMDYPPEAIDAIQMCQIWLRLVAEHGGDNVFVLYEKHRPTYLDTSLANVQIERRDRRSSIGPHTDWFLTFKLAALADTPAPWIYIDADAYVMRNLSHLWDMRDDKPWISTYTQRIPSNPDTHQPPFVSAGVQIVSDNEFYSLEKIEKAFEADMYRLRYPGTDQAALQNFAEHSRYDYTHPGAGTEWNSYAGVGKLEFDESSKTWRGQTQGLEKNHPIYINHYWCEKPWTIGCPMHRYYASGGCIRRC